MTRAVAPSAAPASTGGTDTFHELLSELNPLQYIPVVGTIYRAITGDTIPEAVRAAGSLVVSGLTGGPIGLAISAAAMGLEKATGIDPEKIGRSVLASIGIGEDEAPAAAGTAPATALAQAAAPVTPAAAQPVATAWSAAQLSAYGVTTLADGTLKRGDLQGSDVLNDLVLAMNVPTAAPYAEAGAGASLTG